PRGAPGGPAPGAARRPPPPAPPNDGTRGGAPRQAAGVRARELRELLADGFRMPDAAAGPEEGRDDNGTTRDRSSGSRTSTQGEGAKTAGRTKSRAEADNSSGEA